MDHAMCEHVATHAWEQLIMPEHEVAYEGERSACRWTRRSSVKLPARRRDRRRCSLPSAARRAAAHCPHMEMAVERRCSPRCAAARREGQCSLLTARRGRPLLASWSSTARSRAAARRSLQLAIAPARWPRVEGGRWHSCSTARPSCQSPKRLLLATSLLLVHHHAPPFAATHAWEQLIMPEHEVAYEGERSACRWTRRSSVKLPARRRDRRRCSLPSAARRAAAHCPHMEMAVERRCSPRCAAARREGQCSLLAARRGRPLLASWSSTARSRAAARRSLQLAIAPARWPRVEGGRWHSCSTARPSCQSPKRLLLATSLLLVHHHAPPFAGWQ
ncbi:hypothetical protein Dimus_017357 [Dionaea muscipula]